MLDCSYTSIDTDFSAVDGIDKAVTTAVDQTITCKIEGLTPGTPPATVYWLDPSGTPLSEQSEGYILTQGVVDGDGAQLAELTIKPDKLQELEEKVNSFKCSVRSGLYPDSSPSPQVDVLVTVLQFGKFALWPL